MVKQESVENKMTMSEIAQKGGQSTLKKHGKEHFSKIGAKGRQKTAEPIALGKAEQDGSEPSG